MSVRKTIPKADDPRFILHEQTGRYIKIGSTYHAKNVIGSSALHPYSIITNTLVSHRKILGSDKLNDKQVKYMIKQIISQSMKFKNVDVVQEINELFSLDFSKFLIATIPEKSAEKDKKSMRSKRFTLGSKPTTDVSESETTDWENIADIRGLSRLQLKRQTGHYGKSTVETDFSDTEISD